MKSWVRAWRRRKVVRGFSPLRRSRGLKTGTTFDAKPPLLRRVLPAAYDQRFRIRAHARTDLTRAAPELDFCNGRRLVLDTPDPFPEEEWAVAGLI